MDAFTPSCCFATKDSRIHTKKTAQILSLLQKSAPMVRLLALFPIILALVGCDTRSDIARANEEKILIVGNSNEPKGLDLHLVSGVHESNIIRALFEGLCVDDASTDGVARPGAAERYEHSDDFTAWTFYLQPKGMWSDGTPVTAQDFVFSFKRMLSPDPNWPAKYAEMLYFLENAESYSKNRRGLILMGKDDRFPIDWETLSTANFGGDSSIAYADFGGRKLSSLSNEEKKPFLKYLTGKEEVAFSNLINKSFAKLNAAEKKIYLNERGLDKLSSDSREYLDYIFDQPTSFIWPEAVNKEAQAAVIKRMTEFAGQDLWDEARVGAFAADDFTLQIQLRGPVPFLPEITKHYTWYPVPRHIILKYGKD